MSLIVSGLDYISFPMQFFNIAEIEQVSDFAVGDPHVIKQLRPVFIGKFFYGFQFSPNSPVFSRADFFQAENAVLTANITTSQFAVKPLM